MIRYATTLTFAVLLTAVSGCGMMVQDYTRLVDRGRPAPDPGTAVLVVARRGGIGEMITLIDARGEIIGQLPHDAWVRIPLAPGHHRIYAITGNFDTGSVVDVHAEAGRIYHAGVPRIRAMVAIAPRHEDRWGNRWTWIEGGHEYEVDPALLSSLETELPMSLRQTVVANTDAAFATLDAAHQADYTLGPEDGEVP